MPKPLIVQYTPTRSCLVNLPHKWVNALLDQKKVPQNVILEISLENKKVYCGWSGEASKPLQPNSVFTHGANSKLDVLELDPQFGTALGFQEGQKVNVDFCRNVPECTTVHVEPLTEDDWEILELHAGYVEENLLSQLRVVYAQQTICVWIHNKTLVRLSVASIEPKQQDYVKLTNQSEVIVAPKVRMPVSNSLASEPSELTATAQKKQPSTHLRVCYSGNMSVSDVSVMMHPDAAIPLLDVNGNAPQVVKISKLLPAFVKNNKEEQQHPEANDLEQFSPAKALFARLHLSSSIPSRHIAIGSVLQSTLSIKEFDLVRVSCTSTKKVALGSLILRQLTNHTNTASTIKLGLDSMKQTQLKLQFEASATQAMKTWLFQQPSEDMAISQGLQIDMIVEEKQETFVVQLGSKKGLFGTSPDPHLEHYALLSPQQQQSLSIEFGEQIQRTSDKPEKQHLPSGVTLGGVDDLLHKIERYALSHLSSRELKDALHVPGSGGILVTGTHGSGKTSVVRHLLQFCRLHQIYTMEIHCSELVDERIPVLKETIQRWFDEAAWHGPTLVFLDDLDRLIPAEVEHADSTRSRHLAELFVTMARLSSQRHPILLIATSQQQQSIHPALITHHIFSELRHLQPPNRDERKQIMQAIMSHGSSVLSQSLPKIDLVTVASETEGFVAADLKAFIERTVHEGAIRSMKENPEAGSLLLTQSDFTRAREGFVPSSLRGVKLQSSGVHWSDIGGLNETRKALLETLEWPTKYAAVFAQCPLRLRSGVKGPEILNKYIGASEKSVRDLFERAQAAKPCVLFFDEFDSIAPRRGHDSTGVTDRVVNQMLTQMDGAEGLDGVYVLAATSRPDLIDPALLRPGRLDKALLCGMPTVEERQEILEALSSKMQFAPHINLRTYAEKTEGFSGADLQGFLYNAHLEAIHSAINIETFKEAQDLKSSKKASNEKSDFVMNTDSSQTQLTKAERGQISQRLAMIKKNVQSRTKKETREESNETVVSSHSEALITHDHLEKSFKSTRPSITAEEAYRLTLIYNEFVTGRTGELPSGEGVKGIGKRSTLG
ncbi:Peroxisome biosynthesis protein PAS1 [Choanephora cucurbitarum]|uniref:Peroxisomal ATPase PEX1 n=1 Tax=Choanephora cucurbitarum TaxID=101091 RepID=A0A1C7NT22_9FUNG|nr:Peroxisome biosynthesis protein PAS1 [Choanephora cucurbitarum]